MPIWNNRILHTCKNVFKKSSHRRIQKKLNEAVWDLMGGIFSPLNRHKAESKQNQKKKKKKKRKKKKKNSRKSVRWSAVPVPCLSRLWMGEHGSGPEGVNDLCFHTYGEFSPPPSPPHPFPPASRPISQPGGPYPSLEAQIPVLRPKSQS